MNTIKYLKRFKFDVLIVGGGSAINLPYLETFDFSLIIACDSGADRLKQLNLKADIIIGDFDSISNIENFDGEKIKYPAEKDKTDLELGIDYAITKGFENILLIGATGTRFDHSLSNIFSLKAYHDKDVNLVILDEKNIIEFLSTTVILNQDDANYSIIALSNDGIVVTLEGFRYNVVDKKIELGSSLGVSNYINCAKAKIIVKKGFGLLIRAYD